MGTTSGDPLNPNHHHGEFSPNKIKILIATSNCNPLIMDTCKSGPHLRRHLGDTKTCTYYSSPSLLQLLIPCLRRTILENENVYNMVIYLCMLNGPRCILRAKEPWLARPEYTAHTALTTLRQNRKKQPPDVHNTIHNHTGPNTEEHPKRSAKRLEKKMYKLEHIPQYCNVE